MDAIRFYDYKLGHHRVLGISGGFFVEEYKGKISDLGDRLVIPAFVDAHSHIINFLVRKNWFDVGNINSKERLYDLISEWINEQEVFVGYNFDESKWIGSQYPERGELDNISREKIIILVRIDGHMCVVNSGAEQKLRLDKKVFSDHSRGFVVEDNVYYVLDRLLDTFKLSVVEEAVMDYLRLGIVATGDMGSLIPPSRIPKKVLSEIKTKFYIMYSRLEKWGMDVHGIVDKYGVKLGELKIISDGSIGARTAFLMEPYRDDPNNRGSLLYSEEQLIELVKLSSKLGIQVSIHAIGDAAIDVVINALKHADSELRPRIEHFEMPREDHIKTIKKYGIIPSMQPNFIANWQYRGGLYEKRLGWERAFRMNPLKSILEATGIVAFGSDNMPLDPLYGIYGAMTHPDSSERLDLYSAIDCYTEHSAYSLGMEEFLGKLLPQYEASFLVLDIPYSEADPNRIRRAKILRAVFKGKTI